MGKKTAMSAEIGPDTVYQVSSSLQALASLSRMLTIGSLVRFHRQHTGKSNQTLEIYRFARVSSTRR